MQTFSITNANFEDMEFILSLAKEEGWNPGIYDADSFYATDPNGFFIGNLDGKKIGCISTVAYNEDFGFLGLYVVMPEYRGRGYGLRLWDHAIRYMGSRTIGLDGVIAQQENYKKSHFKLYYRNIRFEGAPSSNVNISLINMKEIPLNTLLSYDAPIFGLNREVFLRHWIEMPNSQGFVKVNKDRISGYGIIRNCVNGSKIGPLFADDIEVAAEIYQGLCAKAGNGPVYLDVPEINKDAMFFANKANMKKVFETARMYKNTPPKQELGKIFGITSFELG